MNQELLEKHIKSDRTETFWRVEWRYRGELLMRKHILQLYWQYIKEDIFSWYTVFRYFLGRAVLFGISDACPHCGKYFMLHSMKPYEPKNDSLGITKQMDGK